MRFAWHCQNCDINWCYAQDYRRCAGCDGQNEQAVLKDWETVLDPQSSKTLAKECIQYRKKEAQFNEYYAERELAQLEEDWLAAHFAKLGKAS